MAPLVEATLVTDEYMGPTTIIMEQQDGNEPPPKWLGSRCVPTTTQEKWFCFGIACLVVVLVVVITVTGILCGSGLCSSSSTTSSESSAAEVNTDAPDNNPADLVNGSFIVLDVSANPVVVSLTPDNYYDLIFYEYNNGGIVYMDHIIVGVSQNSDGSLYYEVFNWGDNIPDTNTNSDINNLPPFPSCTPAEECDNFEVSENDLYPYPGAGVLIDVDNAPSQPPSGTYNYVVIISPISGDGDDSQIDAIVVTEVPIPTP
ncbi:MAG: hypothetical protein HC797_06985 [Anaerolineales bacterium]|nr:hypothetical protein [Anaerolineales bacterium]